jgi:hypothetical protein
VYCQTMPFGARQPADVGAVELMWWTEGYRNRSDAQHAVSVMRTHAASAPVR